MLRLVSQVEEVRDAMENEMRTQLRRQAAAHTDHLRDVLKVQEQELKYEFEQVRTCARASAPSSPGPHTCCLSCTAAPHPSLAFLLPVHSEDKNKVVPSLGEIGFLLVINYRTSSFYISHAVFMVRYVDLKICVGCNTKMSHF